MSRWQVHRRIEGSDGGRLTPRALTAPPARRSRAVTWLGTLTLALLLAAGCAGCGASSVEQPTSSVASLPTVRGGTVAQTPWSVLTSTGQTHYPVTIHDCHGATTYTKPPGRIISLDDSATDTLVALGLADKVVGVTKFELPSQEWPQDAAVVDRLHTLTIAQDYPSLESIVALRPDFVISAFPSAFTQGIGPATPARWKSFGVSSYETVADCGQYSSTPLSNFNLMYTDMHNLGVIFNRQAAASREIKHLQEQVDAAQARAKAAGLGNYLVGQANGMTQSPGTMGVTTNNAIISLAGSTYAFVKQDTNPNLSVSWEQVVKDNPQVFWLITQQGTSVAQMEHVLESNPQLATITAIKHHAYVPISYFDAAGSPRAVQGVQDLVAGLIALKHAGKL